MTWSYVLTAAAMISLPGPDVLLLSGRALERGTAPALRTLGGTLAGYALVSVIVAAGLGALLARWEALLTALRVASAAYLLWLARTAWRGTGSGPTARRGTARGEWRDGFLTAALNPKGLLFFLALLPPFVDPARPAAPQLLALGVTFCAIAAVVYGAVVALAVTARRRVDPSRVAVGRVSALVLVAAVALVGSGAAA